MCLLQFYWGLPCNTSTGSYCKQLWSCAETQKKMVLKKFFLDENWKGRRMARNEGYIVKVQFSKSSSLSPLCLLFLFPCYIKNIRLGTNQHLKIILEFLVAMVDVDYLIFPCFYFSSFCLILQDSCFSLVFTFYLKFFFLF